MYIILDECNILEVEMEIIQGLSVGPPNKSLWLEHPFWVIEVYGHRPGGKKIRSGGAKFHNHYCGICFTF